MSVVAFAVGFAAPPASTPNISAAKATVIKQIERAVAELPEQDVSDYALEKFQDLITAARGAKSLAELRNVQAEAIKLYSEIREQIIRKAALEPPEPPELRRIEDLHYVGKTTVEVTEPMIEAPFGLGLFDFAGSVEDQLTAVESLKNAGSDKAVKVLKEAAGEYGFWVKDLDDQVLLAAVTALVELKQASPEFIRQFLHERLIKRTLNGKVEVTWSTFPYKDAATNDTVRKLYEAFQKTSFLIAEPAVKDFIDYYESLAFPYYNNERRPTSQVEIINRVKYNFQIGSVVKDKAGNVLRAVTAETIEIRNKIVPNNSTLYFNPQTGAVIRYILNGGYTVYLNPDGTSFSTP